MRARVRVCFRVHHVMPCGVALEKLEGLGESQGQGLFRSSPISCHAGLQVSEFPMCAFASGYGSHTHLLGKYPRLISHNRLLFLILYCSGLVVSS